MWKLYLEKFEDPVIKSIAGGCFLFFDYFHSGERICRNNRYHSCYFTGYRYWLLFEYDANKKFDLLNAVNEETLVKVIRNGHVQEVPRKDVVVGDIVILETGEEIPPER